MNFLGQKISLRRILGMIAGVVIIGVGIAVFKFSHQMCIRDRVKSRHFFSPFFTYSRAFCGLSGRLAALYLSLIHIWMPME